MNLPENMTLQDTLANPAARGDSASSWSETFAWVGRFTILLAIVLSPWFFGSVKTWSQFLISIATLTGLAFWWFETALNKKSSQVFPYVGFLLGAGILIGLLQLSPLPDFMLGRQIELYEQFAADPGTAAVAADAQAQGPPVRATMFPEGTWYHIQLLLIALGGLLLGCRLFRSTDHLTFLLAACTVNGAAIAFFGLIQKLTFNGKLFWIVELQLGGQPFGPFVNRNNCAGYLLMCIAAAIGLMVLQSGGPTRIKGPKLIVSKEIPFWRQFYHHLLAFIAELTATKIATIIAIILMSTGVVSSLSRGGVLALILGSLFTLLIYAIARRPKYSGFLFLGLVALVILFSGWVGFGEQLIDRFQKDTMNDSITEFRNLRLEQWQETWPAVQEMGWLGSGLGSYEYVHRIYRQSAELGIFKYAENQYFQALVEGGWAALTVYLLAWLICLNYSLLLLFRGTSAGTVGTGVLAVFLLSSQAVASFFDFGFYIPANMLLMAVMTGAIAYQAHALGGRLKKGSWLKFQLPNYFIQVVLLLVFAGVTFAAIDFYRRWDLDQQMAVNLERAGYDALSLEETEEKITNITALTNRTNSIKGVNYLAELWLHRSRIQYWQELKGVQSLDALSEEDRQTRLERMWLLTRSSRVHMQVDNIRNLESEFAARTFVKEEFIQENYPRSRLYYQLSRTMCPLQAMVHMRLARINSVIGQGRNAYLEMERAVAIAPCSLETNISVGSYFMQIGQPEQAAPYFRKVLELDGRTFDEVLDTVSGRTGRGVPPMDVQLIYDEVIPDEPAMLHKYAMRYQRDDDQWMQQFLERADRLIGSASQSNMKELVLSANIKLELGDYDEGIELLSMVLIGDPGDHKTRFRLGKLLLENGDLQGAQEHADYLYDLNRRNEEYEEFYEQVNTAVEEKKERERLDADPNSGLLRGRG
ncbi:MAG: O-antigen ligase family protein [Planctomycetota bacterium]